MTIAAAIVAVAAGAAFALHSVPHGRAPGIRATIETTIALAILPAWTLFVVHFERRGQIEPLLVLSALFAVGLIEFSVWALQAVIGDASVQLGVGASLVLRSLVPVMFVVAALGRSRVKLPRPRVFVILACSACLGAVAVAQGIDLLIGQDRPAAAGSTAVLVVNVAGACLFVLAAVGLYWRSRPASTGNCLLAAAALLLAAAQFQAVVMPVVPSTWVTPRELFRLAAYGLALAAALAEYRSIRRATGHRALTAERERLARDLHDGLVQDLAALAMYADQLGIDIGADGRRADDPATLGAAARRALAVSRRTLIDLSSGAPTLTALKGLAAELEARLGIDIAIEVEADRGESFASELGARAQQRIVRIAREAIVAAAESRHAHRVDVIIRSRGTRWQMVVGDDGLGAARPAWHRRRRARPGTGEEQPRPANHRLSERAGEGPPLPAGS